MTVKSFTSRIVFFACHQLDTALSRRIANLFKNNSLHGQKVKLKSCLFQTAFRNAHSADFIILILPFLSMIKSVAIPLKCAREKSKENKRKRKNRAWILPAVSTAFSLKVTADAVGGDE